MYQALTYLISTYLVDTITYLVDNKNLPGKCHVCIRYDSSLLPHHILIQFFVELTEL